MAAVIPLGDIRSRAAANRYDAVVVGSGPNGLSAAVMLAQRGASVLLVEAAPTVGGGCRTAELTVPGLRHDVCAAIHPLGIGSPYWRTLPLEKHGLGWIHSRAALAHPFDDAPAALLYRSVRDTAETLGPDAAAYRRLIEPLVPNWDELSAAILNPLILARYPIGLARFGVPSLLSSNALTELAFRGGRAKAFFSGLAGHSLLPLNKPITAAYGLVLAIAGHAVGWPIALGGSQAIADALTSCLKSFGGEVMVNAPVTTLDDLPESKIVMLDIGPRGFDKIAGARLPASYRSGLAAYRYGPAAFKFDWALDGPIPWKDAACLEAATVHLGPARADITRSEAAAWRGEVSDTPYILLAQQTLFDASRVPSANVHAAWGYCHVPNGYVGDVTSKVETQIERFAPGFKDSIVERRIHAPADLERYNPNYVGGDINGGALDLAQFYARPVLRPIPWETPLPGVYLCSASTPPGGGVHGMCGYYASLAALKDLK